MFLFCGGLSLLSLLILFLTIVLWFSCSYRGLSPYISCLSDLRPHFFQVIHQKLSISRIYCIFYGMQDRVKEMFIAKLRFADEAINIPETIHTFSRLDFTDNGTGRNRMSKKQV